MNTLKKFTDPLYGDCVLSSLTQISNACTVVESCGYIDVVDLDISNIRSKTRTKQLHFSEHKLLSRYLRSPEAFISQKDPRSALTVSTDLLQTVINHHHVTPLFIDMLSSFKKRVWRTEDGYCSPVRTVRSGNTMELCYMYKYAEPKPLARATNKKDPWEIRKTGVYHQLDWRTQQSVWIILSPLPASLAETRLKECMQSELGVFRTSTNPFLPHAVLISCYLSNWRDFCTHYELVLNDLSGKVMTMDMGSDFDISHDTLRQANSLKQRFLPLHSIFTALNLVLDDLESIIKSTHFSDQGDESIKMFHNLLHESSAHAENSSYLLQFSERIRVQISDTLSLKNQDISLQQSCQLFKLAQSSAHDSLSIRVITFVTLGYLPFSFVATVMGMCFFEMDVLSHKIIVSSQVWVFFCVSLPLTAFTILLWKWITLQSLSQNWRRKVQDENSSEQQV